MSAHSRSPRSTARSLVVALAAGLLAASGLLLIAAPASAHDELVSTDPAADSVLDASPAQITLTFSEAVLDEDGATEVQVTDAAGTALADGAPVIADNTVTQELLPSEAGGAITVLWKIVSSDGHPTSGDFAFTVNLPTPTPTATPSPTPSPTASATPSPTPSPEPEPSGSTSWPWVIGGILIAAIGGAVIYLLVSRARRIRDEEALRSGTASGSETGAEPPANTSGEPPADR